MTGLRSIILIFIFLLLPGYARAELPGPDTPPMRPPALLADTLAQTAAVVEGEVYDIRETFDAKSGPWTIVHFRGVRTQLGTPQPSTIVVRHRGGRRPDGLIEAISGVPNFRLLTRYILFLRNTRWSIISAAEVFMINGPGTSKEKLTNANDAILTGLDAAGFHYDPPSAQLPPLTVARFWERLRAEAKLLMGGVYIDEPGTVRR